MINITECANVLNTGQAMYSQTFSYTPFRHCSVVPLPPNYSTAIKPPTHIKHRVAFEKRQCSWSSIITKGGLKHLFDVGESQGDEEEPIELPQDFNPFEVPEASPLQTAASCLLTGSIAFLLYRSFKRRAKRAKEKRFRSSGVEDVRKEAKLEALKALEKANSLAEELKPNRPPPSAVQALIGAIMAGAIAYVLYNFTIAVESSIDKQFVSSNYSIRQIKITVRTIINGICYLATCVFAVNSIGLTLYSGQLALNFWMDIFRGESDSKPVETESKVNVETKDDNQ